MNGCGHKSGAKEEEADKQVGENYFRVHPKGVGVICLRDQGLPALTFVEEYLGEVHTPSRWYEIQVFIPKCASCGLLDLKLRPR